MWFNHDQPQNLFDQLPKHCAVQKLILTSPVAQLDFIIQCEALLELTIKDPPITLSFISETLKKLHFLTLFFFVFRNKLMTIEINPVSRQFKIQFDAICETAADLGATIAILEKVDL